MTSIRFSLVKQSYVQIKIYDVTGKEMTIWKSDNELSAGTHEIQFNANNLASGVYFYQLTVTDNKSTKVFKGNEKDDTN